MTTLRAYSAALERPWLILPETFQTILDVLQRNGDPEALAARLGRPLANTRTVTVRDGVAVIPIEGPIVRRANMFTEISGGTSTEILARDIAAALDDRAVHSLLLEIDSPGGEATGINELADLIFEARQQKRIVAYIDGFGASGAYWLGSAATEVVVQPTAMLGSIGTVFGFRFRERAGEEVIEIVSSQSPNKRADVRTDVGRMEFQRLADEITDVFIRSVARNRSVSAEEVLRDFGQGGLRVGADAVRFRMADRIGAFEDVLQSLASSSSSARSILMATTTAAKGPITIRTTDELHAALAAGHLPEEVSVAEIERVDTDAVRTTAIEHERARIQAILDAAPAGFAEESAAAIADGTGAEAFAMAVLKAAKSRGVTLADIQADSVSAVHAAPGAPEVTRVQSVSDIYSRRRAATKE